MDSNSVDALNHLVGALTAVAMTLILVAGGAWLIGQVMKHRAARHMDPKDVAMLEQMGRVAQRMESRLAAVERILDAESPSWRQDAGSPGAGGEYEKQNG